MPDGSSIVLGNLSASDTQGYAELEDAWITILGDC